MIDQTAALVTLLKDGGLLAGALIVIIGGYRGWYVWGPVHAELKKERDYWRELAMRLMKAAGRATEIAEAATKERAGDD